MQDITLPKKTMGNQGQDCGNDQGDEAYYHGF